MRAESLGFIRPATLGKGCTWYPGGRLGGKEGCVGLYEGRPHCRIPPARLRARTIPYFLGGAMVSLATLATRNLTTVFALILIGSPVWGLRPMRALRSALTSLPVT